MYPVVVGDIFWLGGYKSKWLTINFSNKLWFYTNKEVKIIRSTRWDRTIRTFPGFQIFCQSAMRILTTCAQGYTKTIQSVAIKMACCSVHYKSTWIRCKNAPLNTQRYEEYLKSYSIQSKRFEHLTWQQSVLKNEWCTRPLYA